MRQSSNTNPAHLRSRHTKPDGILVVGLVDSYFQRKLVSVNRRSNADTRDHSGT